MNKFKISLKLIYYVYFQHKYNEWISLGKELYYSSFDWFLIILQLKELISPGCNSLKENKVNMWFLPFKKSSGIFHKSTVSNRILWYRLCWIRSSFNQQSSSYSIKVALDSSRGLVKGRGLLETTSGWVLWFTLLSCHTDLTGNIFSDSTV